MYYTSKGETQMWGSPGLSDCCWAFITHPGAAAPLASMSSPPWKLSLHNKVSFEKPLDESMYRVPWVNVRRGNGISKRSILKGKQRTKMPWGKLEVRPLLFRGGNLREEGSVLGGAWKIASPEISHGPNHGGMREDHRLYARGRGKSKT